MALQKLETILNKISTLPNIIRGQASNTKAAFDHDVNVVKDYINDTLTVAVDALDAQNVKLTGNQTISDIKTFKSSPVVPTPTEDMQATPKKYPDDILTTHKSSNDHDERYFTETELLSTTDGSSGANKIGVTEIPTLAGDDVQEVLKSVKGRFDDIGLTNTNVELSNSHYGADGRTYASIGARINTIDGEIVDINAELAAKVNKVVFNIATGNLDFYTNDAVTYSIALAQAISNQDIREYIDTLVSAGTIAGVTIQDGTITPMKTSFFTKSNILDKCVIATGKKVMLSGGVYGIYDDATSYVVYIPYSENWAFINYKGYNSAGLIIRVDDSFAKISHSTNKQDFINRQADWSGTAYIAVSYDNGVTPVIETENGEIETKNKITTEYLGLPSDLIERTGNYNFRLYEGLLNSMPSQSTTGKISNIFPAVSGDTIYSNKQFRYIALWDASMTFLERISVSSTQYTIINASASYACVNYLNTVVTDYSNVVICKTEADLSDYELFKINKNYINGEENVTSQSTYNLFDKSTVEVGVGINTTYGPYAKATSAISGFIPVTDFRGLNISTNKHTSVIYHFYTSASYAAWISKKSNLEYTVIPSTATHVIVELLNYDTDMINTLVVSIGAGTPEYIGNIKMALNKDLYYLYHVLNSYDIKTGYSGMVFDGLGDSITNQLFYQQFISAYFGLKAYYNNGIPSTSISQNLANSMWQDARVNALHDNADLITIMGGVNDRAYSIGEISLSNFDITTFVGAYNVMLSKIYYRYLNLSSGKYAANGIDYSGVTKLSTGKDIRLLLITPSWVGDADSSEPYANAVIEIGKLWNIKVADIYHNSGVNDVTKDLYYSTSDYVHPLISGHKRITEVIIGALKDVEPIYW